MRIRKPSKVPAFVITFGFFIAVLSFGLLPLQASDIVAFTDQYGRTVYINAETAAGQPGAPQSQVLDSLNLGKINAIVQNVASEYQVDPKLVHAIIRVESDYDPRAVSSKGAMGLMQLIPATAERFGVENPFDPEQNIEGGVSYLRYLMNLFRGNLPLSLAAYNAGENSVIRSGGIPAIPETEHYVREITHLYHSTAPTSGLQPWLRESYVNPITRYVDQNGVVHFTNVE